VWRDGGVKMERGVLVDDIGLNRERGLSVFGKQTIVLPAGDNRFRTDTTKRNVLSGSVLTKTRQQMLSIAYVFSLTIITDPMSMGMIKFTAQMQTPANAIFTT